MNTISLHQEWFEIEDKGNEGITIQFALSENIGDDNTARMVIQVYDKDNNPLGHFLLDQEKVRQVWGGMAHVWEQMVHLNWNIENGI